MILLKSRSVTETRWMREAWNRSPLRYLEEAYVQPWTSQAEMIKMMIKGQLCGYKETIPLARLHVRPYQLSVYNCPNFGSTSNSLSLYGLPIISTIYN